MDQNRDDGLILGTTDAPAGADALLDAFSESTLSPAAVEKSDSRQVGAQTAVRTA